MALNTQVSDTAAAAEANALGPLLNAGFIDIYDGAQPANANTAVSTQVKGVRLTFGATAFATSTNGVLTANAITSGTATATITAAWFRALKSDGTTVVMDGTVGTATSNLILPTTAISSGVTVSCSSFTHTIQKATSGL